MFYPTTIKTILRSLLLVAAVTAGQQILQDLSVEPASEVTVAGVLEAALDESVVLVDVRSEAETNVSLIPHAITRADFERDPDQHRGKRVIVYCTVGVRSQAYANELSADGWNAWNYKGSILDWCEHRLPLVNPEQQPTRRVHTFSADYPAPSSYESVH